MAPPSATVPGPETKPESPVPCPDNGTHFAEARRWVDDRVATGRWSDQQREELRNHRHQLTNEQYHALLTKLAAEVNAQRLRIETTNGPPF